MSEESHGFAQARVRLEEIVTQVRKKDVSLEKSLDLLEEGVRLANRCTELIDRADWEAGSGAGDDGVAIEGEPDTVTGDSDSTGAEGPAEPVAEADVAAE